MQCFVDRCLSFSSFSIGQCVVCSSLIYGFWLPLWYFQTLNTFSYHSNAIFLLLQYPNFSHFALSYFIKHIIKSEPPSQAFPPPPTHTTIKLVGHIQFIWNVLLSIIYHRCSSYFYYPWSLHCCMVNVSLVLMVAFVIITSWTPLFKQKFETSTRRNFKLYRESVS